MLRNPLPLTVVCAALVACTAGPSPHEPRIREAVTAEAYTSCISDRNLTLSHIPNLEPRLVRGKVPDDAAWCRHAWIAFQRTAVWWAADVAGMRVVDVVEDGSTMKATVRVTLYQLTEPVVRGGRPILENREVERALLFRKEGAAWVPNGISAPIDPAHWGE